MKTWDEIRASWVNGNISWVTEEVKKMTKKQLLSMVLEAVQQSYELRGQSGDLVDLIEILRRQK